jgi:putative transposase
MVRKPRPKPDPDRRGAFLPNGARAKAGLNRRMLDEAHAATVTMLAYKLAERGGTLVKVPAPYTSQTCWKCKHRDPASRQGIRFSCTNAAGSGTPTPTHR